MKIIQARVIMCINYSTIQYIIINLCMCSICKREGEREDKRFRVVIRNGGVVRCRGWI